MGSPELLRNGKYARVERERRFLLTAAPPPSAAAVHRQITDRYVTGTRLRLRRVEHLASGTSEFKLTQKVPAGRPGAARGHVTNIYLSRPEYDRLVVLPAAVLSKTRVSVPSMSIDIFGPPLHGLVLAEAEFGTDDDASSFSPPPGSVAEVTDDIRFTGGSLARTTRHELLAWLAEHGIGALCGSGSGGLWPRNTRCLSGLVMVMVPSDIVLVPGRVQGLMSVSAAMVFSMSGLPEPWSVVDLFSGAGGMSYGFHAHRAFSVAGAADAQIGKPSTSRGTLGCNATYFANIGVPPVQADLGTVDPSELAELMGLTDTRVTVLCACPPCTGFSRTTPQNHVRDDRRNNLVGRIPGFVKVFQPEIVLIENARELVMGRFSRHLAELLRELAVLGYATRAGTHFLSEFGLPQRRERALVIAVRKPLPLLGLDDLWSGYRVSQKATHVRRGIWDLPAVDAGITDQDDPMHVSPKFSSAVNRDRLAAIPHDGGGWVDLIEHPDADKLLAPSMKRRATACDFGSHPDVYGRMWWDRPAPTIKRECCHVGNGRYAHPEQDRLCTVRELSILQGFPGTYTFVGTLTNMYRHIGDSVPPLISYQLAALCRWVLAGERPEPARMLLPGCHLTIEDIEVLPGGHS